MPEDMKSDYLLKGYVNLVAFLYKDGQSVMKNKYWRQSNIDMLIGDVKAGKLLPSDYGQEACMSVQYLFVSKSKSVI